MLHYTAHDLKRIAELWHLPFPYNDPVNCMRREIFRSTHSALEHKYIPIYHMNKVFRHVYVEALEKDP